ncbi:unnamed protein product [Effrenium voratum]|uniref:Uncharacterized protein n=1 Tax=Effrenium voratum TaxID=2562239 RepID=A0AA36IDQ6_9DINO|nr:unnamed protein product [Effrenium voratum]CAJ1426160.1 unnamed protein product [Effrenium voratum]
MEGCRATAKTARRRSMLLILAAAFAGGSLFVSSPESLFPSPRLREGRAKGLPLRAVPTEEERRQAREMLRDTPVGQMGADLGEDGAGSLYTAVGGIFLVMVLLTIVVLSTGEN